MVIENLSIAALIVFYAITIHKMFQLLTYVGGWKLTLPVHLVINDTPWSVTTHGFFGSIILPAINIFTMLVYVVAYTNRPDMTVWATQAMAVTYPLYNHIHVWLWNRTDRKEKF